MLLLVDLRMRLPRLFGPPAWIFSLVKSPEVFLTLFAFAGIYKTSPYLALPYGFDWTAVMGGLAAVSVIALASVSPVRAGLKLRSVDGWLGLFALIVVLGLLFSRDSAFGVSQTLEFLLLGVIATYIMVRVIAMVTPALIVVRRICKTVVVLAMVTSVLTLTGFATAERAFAASYLSWGYFLGAAILIAIMLWEKASARARIAYGIGIIAMVVSLVLSEARGPVISLGVVLLVAFFKRGWLSMHVKRWLVVLVILASVLAIVAASQGALRRFAMLFEEDKGASVTARWEGWIGAWDIWLKHPGFGVGTGSFRSVHQTYEPVHALDYPHNLILGTASENGIVGVIPLIGYLVSLFRLWRKTGCADKNVRYLLLTCLLVSGYFLVGNMFSGHHLTRQEMLFAGMAVALSFQSQSRAGSKTQA